MKTNSVFYHPLTQAVTMTLLLQASVSAQAPSPQGIGTSASSNAIAFWESVDFYFPGGSPKDFLNAVDHQYKVDWSSIADIPPEMQDVRIPALRLDRESIDRILPHQRRGGMRGFGGGGGPFDMETEKANPLDALVVLYDSLLQARPELGSIVVEGNMRKPSIVLFRSNNPSASMGIKMKAFALTGIPENEWDRLAGELRSQFELLDQFNQEASRSKTSVAIHRDTRLLIVFGPPSHVEVAESLVGAWHGNHPGGENSNSQSPLPSGK